MLLSQPNHAVSAGVESTARQAESFTYCRTLPIRDLTPLAGLRNLKWLLLHQNQVRCLSALSGLTKLRHLRLHGNHISDISAMAGLTNLISLNLRSNQIIDILPLSGLTNLQELDLRSNPLNAEAYEVYIPRILADNPRILLFYRADQLDRLTGRGSGD
ncbi:MAG TPA: leucine-rich repeat domain-containing protein [Sedimentisphaerales bacterium]|nr:leucine-rich repeat domain-containing protein [Sedimentisphaerales bacterium]HNU30115.1 leucine-rich repeat domain-containing protein [Sedimentisphaerales bacterium]